MIRAKLLGDRPVRRGIRRSSSVASPPAKPTIYRRVGGRTMEWDTAAGDAFLRAPAGRSAPWTDSPFANGKCLQSSDVDYANPWFVAAGRFNPFRPRMIMPHSLASQSASTCLRPRRG